MVLAPLVNRLLGRLGVGRKLMLIYLLDLTAVIYISGILINEKFIAIDFARKEVQGNAYISALREPLLAAARLDSGESGVADLLPGLVAGVAEGERRHGAGMDSQRLALELQQSLLRLASVAGPTAEAGAAVTAVLQQGRDLLTRVGNQSNLILDPDLDSYYTMSLIVLRYPELLEVVQGMGQLLQLAAHGGGGADTALRTRYLVVEGRLGAVAQSIVTDHAEAFAAGGPALAAALRPHEAALVRRIDDFRQAARNAIDAAEGRDQAQALAARRLLLADLHNAWAGAGAQLDGLLAARIHGLYVRMALHLGTALALLLVILTVVTVVARSIARPLRHLAGVADEVRRTGDHSLRANWHGRDEIGRLVTVFNGMLEELDRERIAKQELVASARAAEAERALIEATPIAMVVTAIPGHEVLHANPPAEAWLGGRRVDPWKDGLEAAVRGRFFQQLADRGAVDEFEVRWRGERAWAVLAARRVRWQGQDAVLTTFTPINHLKLMEKRLELWAKVFEASSEAIVIVDAERHILATNQAFSRHTGYELQEVLGEPPGLALGGTDGLPDALWHSVALRGSWQGEITVRRRVGSEYPAWLVVNAVRQQGSAAEGGGRVGAGEISHYIFTSIDISDRKKSEQRIRFLAEHDVLTELPNRSLCTERLRLAVQQARRLQHRVAVLFIDLDRFKQINDSLGHHIGDGLLRSVAHRLTEGVREGDTVSRLGGDEFVVVLGNLQTVDEIAHVVEHRLIPRIRQPHAVEGAELHVSCSVGIAVFPDDATDIDELMRHADTAMYQAKAQGRDSAQFFSAEMATRAQARQALEAQLRHALELGQLHLVWQPRVAAAGAAAAGGAPTVTVTGAEGLLRWQHPTLGLVPPSQFIPVAEETGLIVPIGAWVIEQACRQIAAWLREGLPPMTVAINLSARQLRDAGLIDTVRTQLARHRVAPGALELELTESMVMDGAEHNLAQLHALRDLGVGLAVDDFGTGYSSLAYLSRFPIDKLKIDKSFVHDMITDPADRAITTAVIGLGHALDLKVVAEGVEEEAQAALLREAGCDELQGYLIARPMPASDLAAWIRQRRPSLRLAASN